MTAIDKAKIMAFRIMVNLLQLGRKDRLDNNHTLAGLTKKNPIIILKIGVYFWRHLKHCHKVNIIPLPGNLTTAWKGALSYG
jgi:hypothetical protein